jgi:Cupin superfamily protein
MAHRLVCEIEKAVGWSGPGRLGERFTRGSLSDLNLCSRLLTPTGLLDLVMRRSLAPHRLRCLVNGTDLHPQSYISMSTTRRGYSVPVADMYRLGALLRSGCTLIVDQVNAYDPTMEAACRALQWWSREIVQVNTYLTVGDAAGFELHWDDHDVIIVQLAGEKSWEVRGLSRPVPMFRDATPNLEPPEEVIWAGIMKTGDVMHIPRGYWHQATRQDRGAGFSLHVTFGFVKQTGIDWLSWLTDQARQEEFFRHDLTRWGTPDEQMEQQRELTDAATRLVTSVPFARFLDARAQSRPPARHVATHGLFGPLSTVVCVTDFPPAVDQDGELVTVSAAGKKLTFVAKALPALSLLLSGTPVSIAEVTAETGIDAAILADVLVEHDICADVTRELESGYSGLITSEVR